MNPNVLIAAITAGSSLAIAITALLLNHRAFGDLRREIDNLRGEMGNLRREMDNRFCGLAERNEPPF